MTTATTSENSTSHGRQVLRRWPSAAGLVAAAAVLVLVRDRETAAISVCVAALCYLGAAALDRRWVAWAGIAGGSLIVPIALLLGLPWWLLVGIVAAALVVLGLFAGVPRRPLTAQAVAMTVYGVLAVIALLVAPSAGLVLVGAVLACHAIWDVVHYRRNSVVHRSLAEFCMFFDVPLGGGLVVIGLLS
ncbi:MAG TPA: hypothetical protein VF053_13940 [Streptosporangiales bacterium]